jgi:hypothetical protein
MKKSYIQPHSFEVSLHTEGMIAASVGFGNTEYDGSESLTNKKDAGLINILDEMIEKCNKYKYRASQK